MDCCEIVDDQFLDLITLKCPNLTHLGLSSCQKIYAFTFEIIKRLKSLVNLNLYRTMIDQNSIIEIIKSCNQLKVINLGSCVNIIDFNQICEYISKCCSQIECLDLWRAYTLTHLGLDLIAANCINLQELEIGWW